MNTTESAAAVGAEFHEATRLLGLFAESEAPMRCAVAGLRIARAIQAGGKVLACGNGGSAADAMHFCEELTGRYRGNREPLPAIACSDVGHVTCVANDFGYQEVFGRWVRALGTQEDVLIVLSTSGNSPNIRRAVDVAGELGLTRVALLGRGGGAIAGTCEHEIIAPGETADRIQELHMLALHTMIGAIERCLGVAARD